MNRRQLLQFCAALAGASLPAASAGAPAPLHGELAALLGEPKLLRAFGARCRQAMPLGRAELQARCGLDELAAGPTERQLQAFVAQRRSDLQTGNITTVDGWVLADAECALCALIASGA